MTDKYFDPAEYYRGYPAFPYVGMGSNGGNLPFVAKDQKLWAAMQPNKARLATGMLPESAIKLIAQYIVSSVGLGQALSPLMFGFGHAAMRQQITSIFYSMILYEFHIEANLPQLKHFWPLEWNWDLADAKKDAKRTYDIMWKVLSTKTNKQQMRWANDDMVDFFKDFKWSPDNQTREIQSAFGGVHGWSEYEQWMFWYRLLANFLHAGMQAMKQAGLPAEDIFSLLVHDGMSHGDSTQFNRAIANLSAKDWVKMGYGELFSPQDMIAIEEINREFEEKKVRQWDEYKAKQAALNRKIESLEAWERRLKGMATPFEVIKNALGGLFAALEFIGKIPPWVWLGLIAGGGVVYAYPRFIKPMIGTRK